MSRDLDPLSDAADPDSVPAHGEYVVVARRYRPKSFEELVGQPQAAQALQNAIKTNRVGHAYLFTGARGVGKTSTARIFAKCLNCVDGPTATPCGRCDPCLSIASGDDVDVIEIDGASNRRIEEVRQLRSNVNVRPSRSHFKVYIIDEVHMLTTEAFNALLKTLEEPPEHVKFIFCTTNPEKIPITILSRCQRFDFAPVATEAIVERLRFIAATEGIDADEAALLLLARRASGSMRDSQSLLEQLLAFAGGRITEHSVNAMLGTAQGGRLSAIADRLIERDAAGTLAEIDAAVREGVDVGQLAEQLLAYFRDMITATIGCPAELMLQAPSTDHTRLAEAGRQMGLQTQLAAAQILDQAIMRMRLNPHVRTLVEIAAVRICHLEQLDELSQWIAQLRDGGAAPAARTAPRRPAPNTSASAALPRALPSRETGGGPTPQAEKKKGPLSLDASPPPPPDYEIAPPEEPEARSPSVPPSATVAAPWTREIAEQCWHRALDEIGGMTADIGAGFAAIAIPAPNLLVVTLRAAYNKEWCERADVHRRLEQSLSALRGQPMRVAFEVQGGTQRAPVERRAPTQQRAQKMREVEQNPLVQEAIELFGAEVVSVEEKKS